MTDFPVNLTITRENPTGQYEIVRLRAVDHLKTLAQIDLSPSDFLSAVMGQEVIAAFCAGDKP